MTKPTGNPRRRPPGRVSGPRVGRRPVPVDMPRRRHGELIAFLESVREGRFSVTEFCELTRLIDAYGSESFGAGWHAASKEL